MAAHITEHRCHGRQCPACGMITIAPLPDDAVGQFGPHLTALIAYLTVVCRLPRLVVQRLLEGALQIPISLGSTQHAWEDASVAVAEPYGELEAAVRHEAVVNVDETGHRTNGDKRWLWTFVARTFVLYRIATSRGADVLQTVLGATFAGILGSDRLPSYLSYVAGQRQLCWAHVTRNLLSALDLARTPAAKRFCGEALALDRRLFRLWHRFRGDPHARGAPLTRAQLIAKVLPIEKRLSALGERHLNAHHRDVRNLAYAFFVYNEHFFTFVHEEGVEPTNNSSERALRTAVQWRSSRARDDRHYPEFRTMPSVARCSWTSFGYVSLIATSRAHALGIVFCLPRLQAGQERQQLVIGSKRAGRDRDWRGLREHLLFQREICIEIDLRRFHGFVTEPQRNHRSIDARL